MRHHTAENSKEKGRMTPKLPMPSSTWEFFQICHEALGKGSIEKVFGVSYVQARRYCRNPEFTADYEHNPLDRLEKLFRRLEDQYGEDGQSLIMGALLMLASAANLNISISPSDIEPDQDDIQAECLDDYPGLVLLHDLIKGGEHPAVVRQQAETTINEIRETVTLYERGSK